LISSIFVGFFKSSLFLCHSVHVLNLPRAPKSLATSLATGRLNFRTLRLPVTFSGLHGRHIKRLTGDIYTNILEHQPSALSEYIPLHSRRQLYYHQHEAPVHLCGCPTTRSDCSSMPETATLNACCKYIVTLSEVKRTASSSKLCVFVPSCTHSFTFQSPVASYSALSHVISSYHIYSPSVDLYRYGISHIIYTNKYSHIIYIKVCKTFVII